MQLDKPQIYLRVAAGTLPFLAMRSLVEAKGVADLLVRLAGVVVPGKRNAELTAATEDEVQSRFEYISVSSLPLEVADWRAKAVRVLELSCCARDLRHSDESMLLNLGSNWDDHEIIHCCALDCRMDCRARTDMFVAVICCCGSSEKEAAVERALLVCRPILHHVNVCLQAESLVTPFRDVVLETSPMLVDVSAWRAEAMAANWSVLSCSAGRKIIREYSNMTGDFEGLAWKWQLPTLGRFVQLSWSPWEMHGSARSSILKVACVGVFTAADDRMEGVRRTAAAVVGRGALCQPCVDPHFSFPWARRLADRAGRAPTAGHLATETYVLDAKQKHRRMRATVMRRVLGESAAVRRRFWQVLISFVVHRGAHCARGHRSAKDKLAGTSRLCVQRGLKRNIVAVDVFDSQVRPTLPTTVGQSSPGRQEAYVMNLWKNAARERRAAAKAQADKETVHVTFPEYCARQEGGAFRSRRSLESAVQRAASWRTLCDLRERSSWSAGAATSDCEAAVREEQVLGGEGRQHEGSESDALRLQSQGDHEPSVPDEELFSVLV